MNRSAAHQSITSRLSAVFPETGDSPGVELNRQARAFYRQSPSPTMLLSSVMPSIIGLLSLLLYNMFDVYFISHLGSLALIAGIELAVFLFFLAFAPLIAHWLSPTARVAQVTQLYLTYVPLSYAALGLAQLVPSFLNVMQFKCHAMLLIAARAVLLVTLGWLGMHLASVSGTFISIILTNFVAGVCALLVLYRDFHAMNTVSGRKGIQP